MTAGQLSELCNTFASMGHDPGNAWLLGYLAELESREVGGERSEALHLAMPREAGSCKQSAAQHTMFLMSTKKYCLLLFLGCCFRQR
jgi:hypothetical protein